MSQFGSLTASELHCPTCGKSQPVRERLLLALPTGELHDYICVACGSSLGKRTVTEQAIVPPESLGSDTSARSDQAPKLLK